MLQLCEEGVCCYAKVGFRKVAALIRQEFVALLIGLEKFLVFCFFFFLIWVHLTPPPPPPPPPPHPSTLIHMSESVQFAGGNYSLGPNLQISVETTIVSLWRCLSVTITSFQNAHGQVEVLQLRNEKREEGPAATHCLASTLTFVDFGSHDLQEYLV